MFYIMCKEPSAIIDLKAVTIAELSDCDLHKTVCKSACKHVNDCNPLIKRKRDSTEKNGTMYKLILMVNFARVSSIFCGH